MSFPILLPWVLFAAAVAVVLVGIARVRTAVREAAEKDDLIARLESTAQDDRKRLEKSVAKQKRNSEHLEQARRKLEKSRKRAARPDDPSRTPTAASRAEPEGALETARQERNTARSEAEALTEELAKAKSRLATASANKPLLDNDAITALEKRAATAESTAAALRTELTGTRATTGRLREKLETQKLLYVSIRSELSAKKDRLRTQTEEIERLRALKVAVDDVAD
jgi:chromosome segregation ATPase